MIPPTPEMEAKMRQVIEEGRKRQSDREPTHDFAGDRIESYISEAKPLRPYRSQAEKTRVVQGWVLIALNLTTIGLLIYTQFFA